MPTRFSLQQAIRRELRARENPQLSSIVSLIASGDHHEAMARLVFFTSPASFPLVARTLLDETQTAFQGASPSLQENLIAFMTEFSIALDSFLPHWSLHKPIAGADPSVPQSELRSIALRSRHLAVELASATPAILERLLSRFRGNVSARLRAEGVHDFDQAARAIVSESPRNIRRQLECCYQLQQLAQNCRDEGIRKDRNRS